jgi:hypothetical protein
LPKYPAIPEFYDLASAMVALRAVKDTLEQMSGQRQGVGLGSPTVYLQETAPATARGVVLQAGDFWIDPTGPYLNYWSGSAWKRITG